MSGSFLVFRAGERRLALPVGDVERVVLAAETTPIAQAPPAVTGVVNVSGEVWPVFDLRRCPGLPCRETALSDRFVLVRHEGRSFALHVEEVEGVAQLDARTLDLSSGVERAVALLPGEDDVLLVESGEALRALVEENRG